MAVNKSSQGRLPDWTGTKQTGVKLDPGPFIGIIKNNSDPARAGRLAVWIPDISGDEEEADKWYVMKYASPFFGSTLGLPGDDKNNFTTAQQTYGFWAVPPDIGNKVLVTFVMGDPNQGFWFACIPNLPTTHMTPGLARPDGTNIGTSKINNDKTFGSGRISSGSYLPTAELVAQNKKDDLDPKFFDLPRVVHTYQANIVIEQGLDKDPVRGTITSSSQRETPSQVVGLSSPGRSVPDPADFPDLEERIAQGDLPIGLLQQFPNRKGGHSLVLDDGDLFGESRLLRLRSSGGHQILMHDTEDIMYIGNSKGTTWIELTPNGSINIFTNNDFNVRAQQNINFHADNEINFHSGNAIKMYAEKYFLNETESYTITAAKNIAVNAGNVGIKSGSSLLMEAITGGWKTSGDLVLKGRNIYLNTSTPSSPLTNVPFEFYKQANVKYNNEQKLWVSSDSTFESIAPFTPTHEPWQRQTGQLKKNNGSVVKPVAQTKGKNNG
jgi:phage gp45-like